VAALGDRLRALGDKYPQKMHVEHTNTPKKNTFGMNTLTKVSYCCECSWSANAEDHTREELNALIVEHAVETGHDIESALIHPDIDPPSTPLLN
jgi:hypothetical protein